MRQYLPHIREGREHESPIGEYRVAMGLTVAEFCKEAGINLTDYISLQNGTVSPVYLGSRNGAHGSLKPCAEKICDFIGTGPENLFPRYFCKLIKNETLVNSQIRAICHQSQKGPEEIYCLKQAVNKAIGVLDDKLAEIVTLYFLEGYTYEEVGERLNLTRQRVQQLLFKALGKLRGHRSLRYLKAYQN